MYMKHRNIYLIAALLLLPFMAAQATRYYVSLQGTEGGDGSSWANATTLAKALASAGAGDEIWMRGYSTPSRDSIYRTGGGADAPCRRGHLWRLCRHGDIARRAKNR